MIDGLIGKIFAIVLSALGISIGGISFIFNAAKSEFDLFGRIGFGGMLMMLAIVIIFNTFHQKQKNLHFCNGEKCTKMVASEVAYCEYCKMVTEQDNSEPIGI